MTLVSSKEFVNNQKRCFDLALSEGIVIKRGSNRFHLMPVHVGKQLPLPSRKKTGLEEALDDVANGRLTTIHVPKNLKAV